MIKNLFSYKFSALTWTILTFMVLRTVHYGNEYLFCFIEVYL